jgi:hypothetical protein
MAVKTWARAGAPWVCLGLVAGPLPAQAERTIRCESRNFGYEYCRADTDDRVEMVRQLSLMHCRQDRSWGYDRHGVWVDRGCSAEFRVGRRGSHDKAAMAGAAILGIGILAAIASSKNKQTEEEVATWAVGSFSGYDDFERAEVHIEVAPGGSVQGQAGSNSFTGSLKGNLLEAGRHRFRIEASGNGFVATDERNAQHRVVFRRTGGGY